MSVISVITVNFNDKNGLHKTLKSVTNQTYKDFEFIVIDGGSTDGSKELIEKYQNKISYWISEKDNGVFHAMNKGIKAATGEFVIFMNGGDCFNDDFVLQDNVSSLTSEYDIYYGDNYKQSNGSKRLKTYSEKLHFSFFYTSSINHQSTFIRKSLFDKYFYYNEDYKIASDWEFFVYTICHQNVSYKYLKKTIAVYDFTGISSDPKFRELYNEEKKETFQKYFPAFEDDYKEVEVLNSKRFLQFQHIKKYNISWKLLKGFINVLLLFLPKIEKR
ncbi:glycosyltransferase family 2 protein [Flavobacterium anhuiense]|uniref:Glycosyltransferase involved in cell wall bisynthesis n=1 Tax=Flavobacterium anhuiense TaxID=459526 RepID=A0ABY0LHT7_9FLAO|nr:glycosyltransferase family 2 protein [Flavobacterium anhuiense]SCY19154.1 Glycosyltransferase involved in cell wall bisynthesis [Flavobacterium anhuiense]